MRVDSARKWIRQNLPRLQKKFRIEDWEITISVSKSNEDPGDYKLASCNAKSDYQNAYIEVITENIESISQLEMVVSHELLHCVLSPLDQIRDIMCETDNEEALSLFYKMYNTCIERTVRNLELILGLGIKSAKIV